MDDLDRRARRDPRRRRRGSGVADRPMLVMHGALDDVVPVFDSRVIADAHGAADLRIIEGAGHRLRFDPRAVAVFLGWLERANRT
jgi:uncharacterized protein